MSHTVENIGGDYWHTLLRRPPHGISLPTDTFRSAKCPYSYSKRG